MKLFNKSKSNEVKEDRADDILTGEALLQALVGKTTITKEEALNIPTVQACINYASNMVSMIPLKLYKETDGKISEVKNDKRVKLLNDDTGDCLDATQFWRALITDYYLGKGGYAYINKSVNGSVESLHYVDESKISIIKNTDPIYKDFDIIVMGTKYKNFDFIKLLRNSKDGAEGNSILNDNNLILSVAYNSLVYEETLVKKGGNKRGFLKSAKKIGDDVMTKLKEAFAKMYNNNSENVVVLNDGIEFQEASQTSVELQLNENKISNSNEICKIFLFSKSIIDGTATEDEYNNAFKVGIMPILKVIECALNRDLLLEREKSTMYYEFDTKELLKGSIKERFEAYKTAIESNFMQVDEVRYIENLEPLGFNMIKLSLGDVFFNPKTKEIFVPNTGQTQEINMNDNGGE